MSDDEDAVPADFRANLARLMTQERIKRHNWQVCYPSTPANLYHMLRRQCHRSFRKPLIYCFSKQRLRAPNLSGVHELVKGTFFQRVIDGNEVPAGVVPRKLVLCSGQIGAVMVDHKAKHSAHDIAIVFLEQIAPFPWEDVARVVEKYFATNPNIEVVWLQEECKNMGMWPFVRPRLQSLLRHLEKVAFGPTHRISYVGRPPEASPATGFKSVHNAEEQELVRQIFS
jgi:2-oxoglutarate dehydrogenase E1 component